MHLHFKFHENPAYFFKNVKKSYFKSTILKLEKNKNQFENIVFVSIKAVRFQKPNFNSN